VQPPPNLSLLPFTQSPPASRAAPTARLLRQLSPWTPGAYGEVDATEGGPIRNARSASLRLQRLLWQQRLDCFPEFVGDYGLAHG
jgi:hypothetical protein